MDDQAPKPTGWLSALQRLIDSALGLVENRLAIFAVELQEEKYRLSDLLVWLGVALLLTGLALEMVVITLAVVAWQAAEVWGLLLLTLLLAALAAAGFWWVRRKLKSRATPFAATLAEFKKDREWLWRKP